MQFLKKYYIPLGLVLLNIFIKTVCITAQSISHDEPFTIYHAQFDLYHVISYLKNYNNPPLFEIILHFWIQAFGISALSVRILPMLFSSFAVFFIYKTGNEFFEKKVGLLSGLLYTFSTMQIWYAHDCRVYSLFLLLTVISFYLFFKLLKEEGLSRPATFFFILTNILILYAHYFGLFVLFLELIILLFFYMRNKKVLLKYSKMLLFVALGYTPQLIVLFQRFLTSAKNGTWLKPPSGLESIYNMIWSFSNAPVVAVLAIVILVSFAVKLFLTRKTVHDPFVKYLAIWFFFPFLFMFFISYKVPMFLDRYLIFITPAFYLLLALAIAHLFHNKRLYLLTAFVLSGAFMFSSSLNPDKKRLVKDVVEFIRSKKEGKTIVLVCSPEFMTNFVYYYSPGYFQQIEQDKEYEKTEKLMNAEDVYFIDRLYPDMVAKLNGFDKIIYLDAGADFSSPGNNIKQDLESHYQLQEHKFHFELFNTCIFLNDHRVRE
jgi:mannosyltransferase